MTFLFETPMTREQKEYVAQCDYFFHELRLLVNPPSRIHWIKSFMSLDHAAFPPHILHAATLHGHYILKGGPRQQLHTDLVLRQLQCPHDRNTWTEILELQDIENLTSLYNPEAGWRPHNYNELRVQLLSAPAHKHNNNKRFRRELSSRLQEQEKEVFEILAQLEAKILEKNKELEKVSIAPEIACQQIQEEHHVDLKLVEARKHECGICQCIIHSNLAADITTEAGKLAAENLAPKERTTDKCFSPKKKREKEKESQDKQGAKAFQILRKEIERDVRGMRVPEIHIDGLTSDLVDFSIAVEVAKNWVEDVCVDAVKLECGHVFGLKCISLWLNEAQTCPFCRHQLAAPKPEQQYHEIQLDEDDETDDGSDGETYVSAMNALHRFNSEGELINVLEDVLYMDDDEDLEPIELDEDEDDEEEEESSVDNTVEETDTEMEETSSSPGSPPSPTLPPSSVEEQEIQELKEGLEVDLPAGTE